MYVVIFLCLNLKSDTIARMISSPCSSYGKFSSVSRVYTTCHYRCIASSYKSALYTPLSRYEKYRYCFIFVDISVCCNDPSRFTSRKSIRYNCAPWKKLKYSVRKKCLISKNKLHSLKNNIKSLGWIMIV